MENQEKEGKNNFKKFLITFGILFILSGGLIYLAYTQNERIELKNDLLLKEEQEKNTCIYKRDSLTREVNQLSIYKTLTKAMVCRDEASSLLKYKIGDIVGVKIDSSQAVISDIIIGGSKYEYYIKYKVTYSDRTTEELIPELIY